MRKPSAASPQKRGTKVEPVQQSVEAKPKVSVSLGSYDAALQYLDERVNFERMRPSRLDREAYRLDRMRVLLDRLDRPQEQTRFVHVAGSKGKGSTCEMVAAALGGCGYAVGLYTSPHLMDIRERIRINREMIAPGAFTAHLSRVASAAAGIEGKHGACTFFEVLTAAALCYFAEQAVDLAVVEVGLGGRLDSTNVIRPDVAAVTAIQLEHTELLGDTLEQIAREKAGIFKPGAAALTVPQAPGVLEVMREAASAAGARLEVVGEDIDFSYRFESSPELGPHARVCLSTLRSSFEHLPVPLRGEHQAHNCGLALAILDKLREGGIETPETKVAEGLAQTPSHGRLELVSTSPRVIVDGAHNPESVQALMRAIGAHLQYDSMVVVFGCAADKNVTGMLQKIATGADKVIFSRSENPRALDPRELQRRFAEVCPKMTQAARSLPEALLLASRAVGRDDLICVTGSFYLAGEAKRHLLRGGVEGAGRAARGVL